MRVEDLPQGTIPLDSVPMEDDAPVYPTVVLQARANMRKFDNCVLLTRVGGFYELYFEHAEEFGPLLNLKVAQKKTSAGPVSMVRYPSHLVLLYSRLKQYRLVSRSSSWTDS
jgi:MutS domain I